MPAKTDEKSKAGMLKDNASNWEAMSNKLDGDMVKNGYGEIVIYTGIFIWEDGSYHDHQDPSIKE